MVADAKIKIYLEAALDRGQPLESKAVSEMHKWGEFEYRRDNEFMGITE